MTTTDGQLEPNLRVRLKGDPTRHGILTGRTQLGRQGTGLRYQVTFPDATSWIPDDQIELLPVQQESPVDLLRSGRYGSAIDLRRTLTHVRLSGRLADVIYSMEATNTSFYAYQFKPVLRFLMSPSNALLIADEVGLGKTIEAGLIWTELKSRFDLKRLVVFCPAVLRDKWQRELSQKIGVSAQIVDAQGLLRLLKDPAGALRGFAAICSLQGARPGRKWREEEPTTWPDRLAQFLQSRESDEPLIDLLVIDEAHYLRNPESQTHELGKLARATSENLLFLSATPIHNYNRDLHALLRLLDSDTFEREDDLRMILEASRPLVEVRDLILKGTPTSQKVSELLDRATEHPLLRGNRQLQMAREQATDTERLKDRGFRAELARRLETINPLAYVITRTRKREVEEWRVVRDPVREQISMQPCEREFYDAVTEFVIEYAMSRAANERFILSTPQRQMSSSMAATLRVWQQRKDNIDDALGSNEDSYDDETIGPLTRMILDRAYDLGNVQDLVANDSKYLRLREALREYFANNPSEKVIIFSTFRETLNYLGERLGKDGIHPLVMHGGVNQSKSELLDEFEENPKIRVLLSSEIGSEGIDLQFCRLLVNYDLPWNPMRVEQRIGRLDRLGQKASKITIWNLFYEDTIDSRIYERLYEKLDLCRRALGDFEEVLGDEVRKLSGRLLAGHLSTQQQIEQIEQSAQALVNLERDQRELEEEAAHLVAYGDYILNEIRAARELNRWIDGDDLRVYVTDFFHLNYPGCDFRQVSEKLPDFEIRLSNAAKQAIELFIREKRLAPTQLTENAPRPVRCRFDNRTVQEAGFSGESISQFHPLIRFVSNSIEHSDVQLRPAVSVRLSASSCGDVICPGTYLLAVARWSIRGLQDVEKLSYAGIRLGDSPQWMAEEDAERMVSACARYGTNWFEAIHDVDADQAARLADGELFARLEQRYKEYVEDIKRQNEDRADLQLKNLERHLHNQRKQMQTVLQQHASLGRTSLIKATEGRIRALENRIEQRRLKIEARRQIHYRNDEVLVAVVSLT